jgi:hypothetical protein
MSKLQNTDAHQLIPRANHECFSFHALYFVRPPSIRAPLVTQACAAAETLAALLPGKETGPVLSRSPVIKTEAAFVVKVGTHILTKKLCFN